MSRPAAALAGVLLLSACAAPEATPIVTPPAPTGSSSPPTPTQVPRTAVPPTPTPLSPVIAADNVASLAPFLSFAEAEQFRSLAFSADGAAIAAAVCDPAATIGTIRLFGADSGEPLRTLEGHVSAVWGLASSPDGRILASASRDHTAKVWDWSSGSVVHSFDFPNEVVAVEFSPDGRTLAIGGVDEEPGAGLGDATIWTYSVGTWEPRFEYAEYWNIPDIAYTPDGSKILGGGTSRNARVWRTSDGALEFILYHAHQSGSIAVSPDGPVAATGTLGEIWVWDLATGKLIDVLEFPEGTIWVAYTHDGSVLLGGARDGSVRGFATSDHSPLLATTWSVDGSPASIGAMALSPDGRLLATAGSGRIDLWRVEE